MVSRSLQALAFAVAIGVGVAGCAIPVSIPPTPTVTSPVEGVVVTIDALGETDVRGFVLRTPDGLAYAFTIGQLENATAFPPVRLRDREATSSPVRVYFRDLNGGRVVYRLEDAVPASSVPVAT